MTYSYTGDPAARDTDAVRFEIQDTDATAPLLQDEELSFALTVEAGATLPRTQQGIFSAAARCCEVLARRFAAQADTTVGSLKTDYSTAAKNYADRAAELREKAIGMSAPYVGGQSQSEKDATAADPDRIQSVFSRDQFGNSMAGREPYGGFRW